MPPNDDDVKQPSVPDRSAFVAAIEDALHRAACADGAAPGPAMLRRLNRAEYSASVRDLLDIHFDAGQALPDDGAGGEGFDNAAETLFISPIHAEKYLDSARAALAYAFADTRSSKRFLIAEPDAVTPPEEAARKVLDAFLPRAFRRPARIAEIANYLALFRDAHTDGQSYTDALRFALEAVLISPNFLFIVEEPNPNPTPVPLSDHELAVRLSYFLWGSGPDDRLRELADRGDLNDEPTLRSEVERMLGKQHDAKSRGFAQRFVEQWLGTRALGREFKPDPSVGKYDSELEGGMKYEPVFFFHEILTENRPLLDLLDAEYTYANRRLARHYGIKGEFREQPRRVSLDPDSHRGGLLGMAGVLAVSSYPHRTSPVLRGKWILETILGDPPQPPPPDVPDLEEDPDGDDPASLRQKLERHRKNPACATCHNRIDPLGFGLENFDVLGRWRESVDDHAIDAGGALPNGTRFEGPDGLKRVLLERKDQFARHLTRKMLGYALARNLTTEEACTIDAIAEDLKANGYRSHRLILGIVHSVPFRYKAGTDPLAPATRAVDSPITNTDP